MAEKTPAHALNTCAKNVGDLILQQKNLEGALKCLSLTDKGGKLLKAKLDSILKRLERLEQYNKQIETRYYKQLKDLQYDNSILRSRKSELEQSIAGKEACIRETERELSDARDDMNAARRERNRAQEEYDKVKTFWWVPIYGQIILINELIEDNASKANEAQQRMNRYDRKISDLNSDMTKFRNDLSSLNSSIQSTQSSLDSCNRKIQDIQANIGNITSAIAEVLDAKVYWAESVHETQAVNEKTAFMQRLVESGKKNPSKFTSTIATKRHVNIYTSNWERVEYVLSEAFLNKISTTFKCTRCNVTKTSLPYIDSSDNFICEDCY